MIVWINGTHGVGKTTTAALLQSLVPGSRVLDAEKVGEVLMDIRPALSDAANFQDWAPWRPLVVETARRVLEYVGGTLIMPMTVLDERYWREIRAGLDQRAIPVRHFVLDADRSTLRRRIDEDDVLGPSAFRHRYVDEYGRAAQAWLHADATVVDTVDVSPLEVARRIAGSL